MKNQELRTKAKEKGVRHWQIADALGIHESTFACKLRHELPQELRERILAIIDELSKGEC